MRLNYTLNDYFGVAAEFNGGNESEELLRLGISLTPKIHDSNYTYLKFFPYETSHENDTQVGLFTSQKIGKRCNANFLLDYNIDSKTMYLEPELNTKLTDKVDLFVQGRSFGKVKEISDNLKKMQTVIGLKYNF